MAGRDRNIPEPLILSTGSRRLSRVVARCALALVLGHQGLAAGQGLDPGYRPSAYAIDGAKVHTGKGPSIEKGTVVVRDGVIVAVGATGQVAIPFDAEVIDGSGLDLTPGFLDLYTTAGATPGVERSRTGAGQTVVYRDHALVATPEDNRNGITPEYEVAGAIAWPEAFSAARRKLGFTSILAAPGGAIAAGQSALVSTSGLPRRSILVRAPVALHISLTPPAKAGPLKSADDPASAAFEETGGYPNSLMGVIAHLRQAMNDAAYHAERVAAAGPVAPVPRDPALETLHSARTGKLAVWWEAETVDEIHRALDLAAEFQTSATIVGGREAGKVVDRLKSTGTAVVLRLDWPEEPKLLADDEYRKLEVQKREIPRRVQERLKSQWKERVGTAATLSKAGVPFALATDGLPKPDEFPKRLRQLVEAGLTPDDALHALTRDAARVAGVQARLGTIEPGKLAHLVAWKGAFTDEKAAVKYVLADGLKFEVKKDKDDKEDQDKDKEDEDKKDEKAEPKPEGGKKGADEPAGAEAVKPKPAAVEPFEEVESELDDDRKPALRTGGNVLIRGARVLTGGQAGTLDDASILIRGGRIEAVGPGLSAPEGVTLVEARGMVAMPGIIDTHSHMAIDGGVNEMSLSVVPEVRVRDVLGGEDVGVYRALAGGVTTSRLLHGSANTIGGQDAVIKHRWGKPGRELALDDPKRPTGVKFALGENVTRRQDRFPTTRMGVEAVIDRAFDEALAYQERLAAHRGLIARGEPLDPFRRDLRLEALAGILDGSLRIHSHCYRSDEILMLLRTAERHGVRVQSLQHVLEGYKVAPEIAAHGASASTFSDWWAYKVEAYDAIPQNAALLTEAGARVCIKSDSDEVVRHLYLEAAKMMRYGGVGEAQALEMITMNPARELGLEHRIGSIEVGKDGDVALFNAHPFDSYSRCELTLVDGEVLYQRNRGEFKPQPRAGSDGKMPRPSPELLARRIETPDALPTRFALVGGTVHPVSGPAIAEGKVVVEGQRILAVGGPETAVPEGTTVVDVRGLDIWPGLIDAASQVGLSEVGSLRVTQDYSDSARFSPELRTSVALRPDSAVVGVTRANGVLAVLAEPSGGTISGQACVAALDGWVPPEMVVVEEAALVVNVPPYVAPDPERPRRKDAPDPNKDREKSLDALKDFFRRAREYERVSVAARERKDTPPLPDPRLEALAPYVRGERPVIFRADRRREILDALAIARELELEAVVSGGLEAWKVIPELKASGVPVILTGVLRLPGGRFEPTDAPYESPRRLHEAGVKFAIRSTVEGADPAAGARNAPFEAAFAVAHGLPEDAAVASVTLAPAQILGVDKELGSIEPGKRANLVVTAGPVLQVTSEVKLIVVNGRPLAPTNRQTELHAKYRGRLKDVRDGRAILGLDRKPQPAGAAVGQGR